MNAAGMLPPAAQIIVDHGLAFHCSVCLAELCVGVGKYAPKAPDWRAVVEHYTELFAAIPSNRLLVPDAQTWADAGVIAGVLARTQGCQRQQSKDLLNDAVIYLCAARHGLPVLTDNKSDFDLLQQMAPDGSFIFV